MRVFFFRHGLTKYRSVPGRYAYQVSSSSLHRDAASSHWNLKPFDRTIYADGYDAEQPGSNVDPNVFSDLLPWFLAYCLIDSTDPKRLVSPHGEVLSKIATKGDLIVFGNVLSTHLLFVDTVIRVGDVVELPQRNGRFTLRDDFAVFRHRVGLDAITWPEFAASRTYGLNLIDSMLGGNHDRAHLQPHLIIIGTRCLDPPTAIDGLGLLKRFRDGDGFNFIPLADAADSTGAEVRKRPGLFVKRFVDAAALLKQSITELPDTEARRMLDLVLGTADTIVLDPIQPRPFVQRGDPRGRGGC